MTAGDTRISTVHTPSPFNVTVSGARNRLAYELAWLPTALAMSRYPELPLPGTRHLPQVMDATWIVAP